MLGKGKVTALTFRNRRGSPFLGTREAKQWLVLPLLFLFFPSSDSWGVLAHLGFGVGGLPAGSGE